MHVDRDPKSNIVYFTGRVLAEIVKGGGGCLTLIMSSIGIFVAVVMIIHKALLGISKFL